MVEKKLSKSSFKSSLKIRVRRARISDAAFLSDLSEELGYPSTKNEMIFRLKNILSDPSHAVFAAESAEKSVIGWIHVCVRNCVESNSFAEIVGLVVAHQARGKGIGALLMQEAEKWSLRKRLHVICLRSRTSRKQEHQFYKHRGYKITKTQRVFIKGFESLSRINIS